MNLYLSGAYKALNKCLFDDKLPPVDFVPNFAEKYLFQLRHLQVIEVGHGVSAAKQPKVFDELLHVMVHQFNLQGGIADFTNNQYHKREFCEKALDVGLMVIWHRTRGWGVTTSNSDDVPKNAKVRYPSAKDSARRQKCYETIQWPAAKFQQFQKECRCPEKCKKVFLIKYVCKCDPPVIIRSGRRPDSPNALDVTCNICNTKFVVDS